MLCPAPLIAGQLFPAMRHDLEHHPAWHSVDNIRYLIVPHPLHVQKRLVLLLLEPSLAVGCEVSHVQFGLQVNAVPGPTRLVPGEMVALVHTYS